MSEAPPSLPFSQTTSVFAGLQSSFPLTKSAEPAVPPSALTQSVANFNTASASATRRPSEAPKFGGLPESSTPNVQESVFGSKKHLDKQSEAQAFGAQQASELSPAVPKFGTFSSSSFAGPSSAKAVGTDPPSEIEKVPENSTMVTQDIPKFVGFGPKEPAKIPIFGDQQKPETPASKITQNTFQFGTGPNPGKLAVAELPKFGSGLSNAAVGDSSDQWAQNRQETPTFGFIQLPQEPAFGSQTTPEKLSDPISRRLPGSEPSASVPKSEAFASTGFGGFSSSNTVGTSPSTGIQNMPEISAIATQEIPKFVGFGTKDSATTSIFGDQQKPEAPASKFTQNTFQFGTGPTPGTSKVAELPKFGAEEMSGLGGSSSAASASALKKSEGASSLEFQQVPVFGSQLSSEAQEAQHFSGATNFGIHQGQQLPATPPKFTFCSPPDFTFGTSKLGGSKQGETTVSMAGGAPPVEPQQTPLPFGFGSLEQKGTPIFGAQATSQPPQFTFGVPPQKPPFSESHGFGAVTPSNVLKPSYGTTGPSAVTFGFPSQSSDVSQSSLGGTPSGASESKDSQSPIFGFPTPTETQNSTPTFGAQGNVGPPTMLFSSGLAPKSGGFGGSATGATFGFPQPFTSATTEGLSSSKTLSLPYSLFLSWRNPPIFF